MEIMLVRHGETEWSLSGQHTSRTDLPLTEHGRELARRLGQALAGRSFAQVRSSPLRRARETCELAGLGEQMQLEPEVTEWDYGEYEGLTTPEIRAQRPDWRLWRDGCPGGEQPDQVAIRADHVLARLHDAAGDSIVFAHGHILRVVAARWMQEGPEFAARLKLDAGSVSVLGFEDETPVLARWNAER